MAIDLSLLSVRPVTFTKVLREGLPAGVHASVPRPHGPAGMAVVLSNRDGQRIGSVITTQARHGEHEWLHASLAWVDRMPDYDDLKMLKAATFGPDRVAYQVFPTAGEHINFHKFCLHLWGRSDGVNVLPDFGAAGTI